MSAILNDWMPAVRDCLLEDAALAALVTGGDVPAASSSKVRVYSEDLPTPPIPSTLYPKLLPPTILIKSAPSPADGDLVTMAHGRVELRTYHLTREQARALWFRTAQTLIAGPYFSSSRGVWFEAGAPIMPSVETELGSEFIVARGMIPLTLLFH